MTDISVIGLFYAQALPLAAVCAIMFSENTRGKIT